MISNQKVAVLIALCVLCCSPMWLALASATPKKGMDAAKTKKQRPAKKPAGNTPNSSKPALDQELIDVAELFAEKGDFASALDIYDELRRANPDNLDLLDASLALCERIPACKPRIPGLLDALEAFIARNAESAPAKQLLLDYSQEQKDTKRASRAIVAIVKAAPDTPANWLLLVDHHEDRRAYKAEDALLAKLIKRFPQNPEVWLRVADRRLAVNDLKGARAALAASRRLIKPTDQLLHTQLQAYERELRRVIEGIHKDYRQDTRWADLEDDFAHSTYP